MKRPRWRPVGLNDPHLRSHGKIGDCEQSTGIDTRILQNNLSYEGFITETLFFLKLFFDGFVFLLPSYFCKKLMVGQVDCSTVLAKIIPLLLFFSLKQMSKDLIS